MELFALADRDSARPLAITEAGETLTCGDLDTAVHTLSQAVGGHRLVFLLCKNTPGTLLGYLACLKTGAVPLLLDAGIAPDLLHALAERYQPAFLYVPEDLPAATLSGLTLGARVLTIQDGCLLPTAWVGPALHPDLALLLTTSGSTGSPKLVRLSGQNLDANARAIADYLALDENERPITVLPMAYSYGMSVINSHLLVGAPLLLCQSGLMERGFWEMLRREGGTSLVGVPYTYQMYKRLGLMDMDLPALTTLTQAGGKLSSDLHRAFATWAARTGRRFFVMYGQTEAGPRMGYLPAQRAVEKCGAMGIPIPGGAFWLEDEAGAPVARGTVGELIYRGPNVAMGYAECSDDLHLGDQWEGILRTGDMAVQDTDGIYSIVGRKKRFLKLFGNRVNLDETERMLAARFQEGEFACTGRDDCMNIFIAGDHVLLQSAPAYLSQCTRLPPRAFQVHLVERIPKNEAGKTQYAALEALYQDTERLL